MQVVHAGAAPARLGQQVSSRRSCVRVAAVHAQQEPQERHTSRRALLAGAALAAASAGRRDRAAQATDYQEALAKKEARKARLKAAAGTMKTTGNDQQVFNKSDYSLPEEARTPNMHSRQNEGARTQENV